MFRHPKKKLGMQIIIISTFYCSVTHLIVIHNKIITVADKNNYNTLSLTLSEFVLHVVTQSLSQQTIHYL